MVDDILIVRKRNGDGNLNYTVPAHTLRNVSETNKQVTLLQESRLHQLHLHKKVFASSLSNTPGQGSKLILGRTVPEVKTEGTLLVRA